MEFKRIEVKKTLRHQERIKDAIEIKKLFDAMSKNCLQFSSKIEKFGTLKECSVMSVTEKSVQIFSRAPQKTKINVDFSQIESIEVESNCNFVEENDDGGRWARLI